MTAPHGEFIVNDFIRQLSMALDDLPSAQREEIVGEISEHIHEVRQQHGDETDAELRSVLDRIGTPDDIAADARERFGLRAPADAGPWEFATLAMLIAGTLVLPVISWLLASLTASRAPAWTASEKRRLVYRALLVTLGVLAISFLIPFGFAGVSGPSQVSLWGVLFANFLVLGIVLIPLVTGVQLAVSTRKRFSRWSWAGIGMALAIICLPVVAAFGGGTRATSFIGGDGPTGATPVAADGRNAEDFMAPPTWGLGVLSLLQCRSAFATTAIESCEPGVRIASRTPCRSSSCATCAAR